MHFLFIHYCFNNPVHQPPNHKSTSQARAARQVASIESKAATKLEKCRKRHSVELADKDKEIKVQYI